jgi:hypothetical protein
MDTEHTVFLITGVVVVLFVGRLIVRSGRHYIAEGTNRERGDAASGANLVAVLFHLSTFGLIALIAVIPLGGAMSQRYLLRLGILLLVLAVVYGITLSLLQRRREEAMAAALEANPPRRDKAAPSAETPAGKGIGGVPPSEAAAPDVTVKVEPRQQTPRTGGVPARSDNPDAG